MQWLQEVTSKSYTEILTEANSFLTPINYTEKVFTEEISKELNVTATSTLPDSCVNLEDNTQLEYYNNHKKYSKIITTAVEYCTSRRLFTAVNRCKSFYVSLDDKRHKDRLVIPFHDNNNAITCYQTRALNAQQFPKYLTKTGDKTLFGGERLDSSVPYIFIFEGPIDSMFVKNGVAMAGTDLTELQQNFLDSCISYEKIFVFDNDKNNEALKRKIKNKLKLKHKVFIWPKKLNRFKDINEVCCKLKLDEFSWKFIVENSFSNTEGLVKYTLSTGLSSN